MPALSRDQIADVLAHAYDGQPLTQLRDEHAAHHLEAADKVLARLTGPPGGPDMTTPTLTALAAAVQCATVDRWRDVQPGIAEVLTDWAETRLEDGALMLSAEVRGLDPERALHRFAERQALWMANRAHVVGDLLPALDVSVPGREACVWRRWRGVGGVVAPGASGARPGRPGARTGPAGGGGAAGAPRGPAAVRPELAQADHPMTARRHTLEPAMTTPADELRTAAAKLLALTANVTPGPWAVHNPNGYPQAVFGENKHVIFAEVLDEIDQPKPHAAYIAAMHPGVGAALAAWLEETAHAYECGVQAADDVFRNDLAGREAFLTTGPGAPSPAALAVARQINAARS